MNIVRGWPIAATGPEGAGFMRVPHAPQKANPAWTGRPQLGHETMSAGAGLATAGAEAIGRGGTVGPGVGLAAGPVMRMAVGGGVCGTWKGTAAGIFGESPQGMPPLGLMAGLGLLSSPAAAVIAMPEGPAPTEGAGGRTVRAVSSASTTWAAGP
jgi:hypothetical protein